MGTVASYVHRSIYRNAGYVPCKVCKTFYASKVESCPVCKVRTENEWEAMMSIVSKLEAAGAKVKDAVLKAVSEVDGVVLPDAAKLEPFAAAIAEAVVPGSSSVVVTAENVLLALAKVIDVGGAAAESNLTNAGLDTALIASVKGLIPSLKAAAKS